MKFLKILITILFQFIIFTFAVYSQSTNLENNFINVPNGKLYYETAGNGSETIVLVHDGLVHQKIWDNQFAEFSKNYKVVRYDRRGYGKSTQPQIEYSNIEDLNIVFTTLNIEKAIVIGMSAGGGLTIDFTLKYPEKISALILVGAVVSGFGYTDHMGTRGGRLTAADYGNPNKLLKYFILEDPYEIAPQNIKVKEKLWKLMQDYPLDFTKNQLDKGPDRPAKDFLKEIKVPAFIVIGEFDIPDVFVHAGVIESGIKLAQRTIIPNAGHLVPLEQPDEFNKQVMSFLEGAEFFKVLNTEGASSAAKFYKQKKNENKNWSPFTENRINALGYISLQNGKINEAIELFKLNVLAYPNSSNVYDSLAEAYMKNGENELAIKNYQKSLELNPDNTNAIRMLEKLNNN